MPHLWQRDSNTHSVSVLNPDTQNSRYRVVQLSQSSRGGTVKLRVYPHKTETAAKNHQRNMMSMMLSAGFDYLGIGDFDKKSRQIVIRQSACNCQDPLAKDLVETLKTLHGSFARNKQG